MNQSLLHTLPFSTSSCDAYTIYTCGLKHTAGGLRGQPWRTGLFAPRSYVRMPDCLHDVCVIQYTAHVVRVFSNPTCYRVRDSCRIMVVGGCGKSHYRLLCIREWICRVAGLEYKMKWKPHMYTHTCLSHWTFNAACFCSSLTASQSAYQYQWSSFLWTRARTMPNIRHRLSYKCCSRWRTNGTKKCAIQNGGALWGWFGKPGNE